MPASRSNFAAWVSDDHAVIDVARFYAGVGQGACLIMILLAGGNGGADAHFVHAACIDQGADAHSVRELQMHLVLPLPEKFAQLCRSGSATLDRCTGRLAGLLADA